MLFRSRACFASVAPGLEHIAATELSQLSVSDLTVTEGGVTFTADDRALLRCNLRLRSVSRVIVRVAQFRATAFSELERLAKSVPWEEFVAPRCNPQVEAFRRQLGERSSSLDYLHIRRADALQVGYGLSGVKLCVVGLDH